MSERARRLRVYAFEAVHELREGLRGPLVPLMFTGLVGYVFMMLGNAEYLRNAGASDVPRNSPYLVYQLTSGQSFWLIFVWAWVFAQAVARDRAARADELVLACPVLLCKLLLARYLGALALALILGSSSTLAIALVPALGTLGMLPAGAIGPTPWLALGWAWLLFVLPSAAGLGALYLVAAMRTRSSAGPFAVAAVVILVWMIAMIVLRGADAYVDVATLIDASGFGEAERQSKEWTPHEKVTSLLALTTPLLLNRLLWTLVPLALLGGVLARSTRESLCLERAPRVGAVAAQGAPSMVGSPPGPVTPPAWPRVTLYEAGWQLRRMITSRAFLTMAALWVVINVAGPFVHMLGNAEGPIVPRPHVLGPFLISLVYVFSIFVVAGFVGALVRRDQQPGLDELIDATPAPLGVRLLGKAVAALGITTIVALLPTVSAWIVLALVVPGSFAVWDPLLINLFSGAPALLELGAFTFLTHALVRPVGTAHALAMFAAFVAVVNHELELVSYPPAQFGIPAHLALSELAGWAPWLPSVAALDALKLSTVALMLALAWLAEPRGTALTSRLRLIAAAQRARGVAGVLACVALGGLVLSVSWLHEGLVVRGGYLTPHEERAERGAWETQFAPTAAAFAARGGEVAVTIDPEARRARASWTLQGVRASAGTLGGSLGEGMTLAGAVVDGRPVVPVQAHDQFSLALGACAQAGCEVRLDVEVRRDGFPWAERPLWLHEAGVWARASDLLPRLGFDFARMLRAPGDRRAHGLAADRTRFVAGAAVPALAVAPAGAWRWSVHYAHVGADSTTEGRRDAPLDFAVAWVPPGRARVRRDGDLAVWHGAEREDVAVAMLEDVRIMHACVQEHLGEGVLVREVMQAPREHGALALHGTTLWVPEDAGWDVGPQGVGRFLRRAAVAQALAARALADASDLREEPGARWLTDGVAGWLGLLCVHAADGDDAWLTLLERKVQRLTEKLGALDAPIASLADDGAAAWVGAYAPLSVHAWAHGLGTAEALRVVRAVLARVRAGESLRAALEVVASAEVAERLLGPPLASEVHIVEADARETEVRGERAHWSGGGWQPYAGPLEVVVQRVNHGAAPASLPTRVARDASFTAFDAWPSFERAPRDNFWRAPGLSP
ncbi:MAG: ABC transporter permease [Polyangiales bacterium]